MCKDGELGGLLEVSILFYVIELLYNVFVKFEDELCFVFIILGVMLMKVDGVLFDVKVIDVEGLWLSVNKVSGEKCVCCWYYCEDVGLYEGYEEFCGCCVINIDGDGEECYYV